MSARATRGCWDCRWRPACWCCSRAAPLWSITALAGPRSRPRGGFRPRARRPPRQCRRTSPPFPMPYPASKRAAVPAIRPSTRCWAVATRAASAAGYVERGVASWYGPGFHGVQHFGGRALRHVRHDRGAQDAAAALLRARHQPAEWPLRGGAHQRPRPVRRQPHHRPVLHRRGEARHAARRHRDGRSARGDAG